MSPARPRSGGIKIGGGRVYGTFRAHDVAEVQAVTLISFATDLVMTGANGDGDRTGRPWSILDLRTTFLASPACETVEGEAFLLHRNGPISIWQCDLRAPGGPPLAQVVHTLLDRDGGGDHPAQAAGRPP